jgi:hypothetical protein
MPAELDLTEGDVQRELAIERLHTARLERESLAERLEGARADRRWQRKVLPFMMLAIVMAAVFFGLATYVFFNRLQSDLDYARAEPFGLINRIEASSGAKDPAFRDWAARATLEQHALQQRFNVQVAIVKGRLWARFMGFLTGMILALTGCVFVLGKLRADVDFSGSASGAAANLKTTSPGIFLALLGTVVIGMALGVSGSVEGKDAAIYLPAKVPSATVVTDPPVPLPASDAASTTVPAYPSPFEAERQGASPPLRPPSAPSPQTPRP